MKKLISVILLTILLLNTTVSFSSCNNYSSEGVVFELSNNSDEYYVTRYTGNAKKVLVPAEYEGLPVTCIRAEVFKGNDKIKEVHLPDTVYFIADSAFMDCPSLSSIVYDGTMKQWNSMRHRSTLYSLEGVDITCSDGKIEGKIIPPKNSKTWEEREKYDVFFSRENPLASYDMIQIGIIYNYENENFFPDEGVESTKSSEEPEYDENKLNQVIDEAVSRLCNVDGYILLSYDTYFPSIRQFEGEYWYYVCISPRLLEESTGDETGYWGFSLRVAL